jgi:proteic killer suppression protein
VIQSFTGKLAEKVWQRYRCPALGNELQRSVYRKLLVLDAADHLDDLRVPPGNRLERLAGDRKGQYSIRANSQWRICFRWTNAGPCDVEVVDYH